MAEKVQVQRMVPFKFEEPEVPDGKGKISQRLATLGALGITVQKVHKDQGETNLHAHSASDAHWFVLEGQAEFYGYGDVKVATLGKWEGLSIPHGVPYWFKAVSDEPLVIAHVSAVVPDVNKERVNYQPQHEWQNLGGREATDEEKRIAAEGVTETLKSSTGKP